MDTRRLWLAGGVAAVVVALAAGWVVFRILGDREGESTGTFRAPLEAVEPPTMTEQEIEEMAQAMAQFTPEQRVRSSEMRQIGLDILLHRHREGQWPQRLEEVTPREAREVDWDAYIYRSPPEDAEDVQVLGTLPMLVEREPLEEETRMVLFADGHVEYLERERAEELLEDLGRR